LNLRLELLNIDSFLPAAESDENEERYNSRVAALKGNLLCLDRKLVKPTGATSSVARAPCTGDLAREPEALLDAVRQ
jgi:uncharacterized protein (TIGR04141 family)